MLLCWTEAKELELWRPYKGRERSKWSLYQVPTQKFFSGSLSTAPLTHTGTEAIIPIFSIHSLYIYPYTPSKAHSIHLQGLPKRATCNCPSLLPSRLHLLYPPPVTSLFQYSVYIKKILRPIPNDASSKKCLLILPMCLPHPAANCHYFSIETQGSWYLLFSI